MRSFHTTSECIAALRADERQIWSTDLSQHSVSLDTLQSELPPKLAVVIGNEANGVSEEMLANSDCRIYLPIFGWLLENQIHDLHVVPILILLFIDRF